MSADTNFTNIPATRPLPQRLHSGNTQGSVVHFLYRKDREGRAEEKSAQAYLPAGYTDSGGLAQRYDVLYLLLARPICGEDPFHAGGVAAMLDYMIFAGMIPPIIVILPEFRVQGAAEQLSECRREIEQELIPAVEEKFHTYADTPDSPGLTASRAHRAIGGFSLGGVMTWDFFLHDLDWFRGFLPMSGDCWARKVYGGYYVPLETAAFLDQSLQRSHWNREDFRIYAATGTADPMHDQLDRQMKAMRSFTGSFRRNVTYRVKKGGGYDLEAVKEYLYNALPELFAAPANPISSSN